MKLFSKIALATVAGASCLALAGCGNHSNGTAHTHSEATKSSRVIKDKRATHKKCNKHNNKTNNMNSQKASSQHKVNGTVTNTKHNTQNVNTKSNSNSSNKSGQPTVDLGNGIQANEDHGAGQTYISFSKNGHNVVVHGNNFGNGNSIAINKARNIANNINKLPANQKQVMVNATINQ